MIASVFSKNKTFTKNKKLVFDIFFKVGGRRLPGVNRESQRVRFVNVFSEKKYWCCIIKVDTLFSRILIYNHNQYENRRKTYGTKSKIL